MPLRKSSSAIDIAPSSGYKSPQKSHHSQTPKWSYEPASDSNTEKIPHNSNTYHTWEAKGSNKNYAGNSEMSYLPPKKQRWTKD
ncbi:hypothetical protein BofuT4_uP072580.1 [Botrytis cinerea T4]|uniref:Uncharacterized protein n=1 Tax=Botryotinia fuckeliana (strain T4) TaxID=999810 RepID=G2XPN5_BOTF4|nr:hypothetical protein BofuT4_uP072580.1 [Botrytis cinerea T4]